MIGYPYIKSWEPGLTPLITLILGAFAFLSIAGFGRIIMRAFKIDIVEPWNLACRVILGIFCFSLINQILAFAKINSNLAYAILLIVYSIFGFWELKIIKLKLKLIKLIKLIKLDKRSLIPAVLFGGIFSIRCLVAVIPSTKIDELAYHMLLPLRIISDQGLTYYHFPWEGAIWPHMHYQLISPPFYSLGYPDSLNIISIGIFTTLVYTSAFLVFKKSKNLGLSLWCAVLITSGLNSLVEYITVASNSLLVLSSSICVLILCQPREYLPSKDLKSFSIFFSILFIGIIGSKISMAPISILLVFIFLKIVKDLWASEKVKNAIIFFTIPVIVFYIPLLVYTWIESGSPFGPMLSSFFSSKDFVFDPLIASYEGEMGTRRRLIEIFLLMVTKWSPLIWICWLFLPHKKVEMRTKLTLFMILLSQLLIIFAILPTAPRHFGGLQYCALIICFVELAPRFYTRFKKYSVIGLLSFSLPWLALDLYYSSPLIIKSFFQTEVFKKNYVPFYEDFIEIDHLIEKEAQILVDGTRLNAFHSPRIVFENEVDIRDTEKPTYLFAVGLEPQLQLQKFKLGSVIYKNPSANQHCYRTPGSIPMKNKLILYKLDNESL